MKRELLAESDPHQTRVAVLESGRLVELFIERHRGRGQVGNLYKGRVRRVLPGMSAAFVDIGLERDGYLFVDDVEDGAGPRGRDAERDADRDSGATRREPPPIDSLLRRGQELIVQVTKDRLMGKGARVTANVTLPGRYLVLTPTGERVGVSKRIEDADERERLRLLASEARDDSVGASGCIVRTAAAGATARDLQAEYELLAATWQRIEETAADSGSPALLRREEELAVRVIRDRFAGEFGALLVDGADIHRRIRDYLARVDPELLDRVERTRGGLFERYRIDEAIEAALEERAPLPSGGYLVINQTEALVAIDVNTGRNVGSADFEETVLRTNLEAVAEAVVQIRLRDLSGILVIDLIDMEREDHREQVFARLEEELRKDRARHKVLGISEFGLVQLTRQRSRANLERMLTRACPHCEGTGRIKSVTTTCLELWRTCLARAAKGGHQLAVRVHPEVLDGLSGAESEVLDALHGAFEAPILLRADPELRRDHFVVAEIGEP